MTIPGSATDADVTITGFTGTFDLMRVDISNAASDPARTFSRLVLKDPDFNSTVVSTGLFVGANGVVKDCNASSDADCYPQPTLNTDGSIKTFNSSMTDTINDDEVLGALATLSGDDDETTTTDEKVADLRIDICDAGADPSVDPGNCTWDSTEGKLVIPEEAFLDYMSEDK
jgi:hypothetical protein